MSTDTSDRMALVGAASLLGREIKDHLAEAGFPGRAVELLDLDDEVGLLTDYGSEARVVAEAGEASVISGAPEPRETGREARGTVWVGAVKRRETRCRGRLRG